MAILIMIRKLEETETEVIYRVAWNNCCCGQVLYDKTHKRVITWQHDSQCENVFDQTFFEGKPFPDFVKLRVEHKLNQATGKNLNTLPDILDWRS